MSTISTTITTAVTLGTTGSYTSPLTITSTGEVKNNSATAAIYAASGIAVISNSGQIIDKKGAGVYIKKSGTITNLGSAALISGGDYGIYTGTTKLSTITNQGTIQASSITGTGIFLKDGGFIGNTGSITGGTGTGTSGIEIAAGGTIQNLGSTALISAGAYGIDVTGATAETITNQGRITATTGDGINLVTGGAVRNTGTITGGTGTKTSGIQVQSGGSIQNYGTSALIAAGAYGINAVFAGAETITNQGTITGFTGDGIYLQGGVVSNTGTITGGIGTNTSGIKILSGGSIQNTGTAALIAAGAFGIDITGGTAETIINQGTITATGTTSTGIYLQGGGTITNAGTIRGGKHAIIFAGGTNSRLIIDPRAVFGAPVSAINMIVAELELAAGTSPGTITGLGTQFSGFSTLSIDSNADWVITGPGNTVNSVTNNGTFELGGATLNITGSLTGTGTNIIDAASRLAVNGTIAAAEILDFHGTGAILQLGSALPGQNILHGFTFGDTIDLAFATQITGTTLMPGNFLVAQSANPANSITLALDPGTSYQGDIFSTVSDAATGGFDIILPTSFVWGGASTAVFSTASSWQGGAGFPILADAALFNLPATGPYTATGNGSVAYLGIDDQVTLTGSITASAAVILGAAGGHTGTLAVDRLLSSPIITLQNGHAILDITAGATVASEILGTTGGTIINAGTIAGTGTAIDLSGIGNILLVDDPGAVFLGSITASASAASTLELAAGIATGTFGGLGKTITGFTTVEIDPAAKWLAAGGNAITGSFINNGTLSIANGGLFNINGALSGTGQIDLGNAATLIVSGSLGTNQSVSLGTGGAVIELGTLPNSLTVFTGVTAGNEIILENTQISGASATYTPGVGVILYENSGNGQPVNSDVTLNISQPVNISFGADNNTTLFGITSLISTLVTSPVIAGTSMFAGNLTITPTGEVAPANGSGVTVNTQTQNAFLNQGIILVNQGAYGFYGIGPEFGHQLDFTNSGEISGGTIAGARIANGTFVNTGNIQAAGSNGIGVEIVNVVKGFGFGAIVNYGTISGAKDAVYLNNGPEGLIVEPGAVFNGNITTNQTQADYIELVGSSAIALTGFGTKITNFHNIEFASGSNWTIEGNVAGIAAGQVFQNLGQNTIVIDNFVLNPNETSFVNESGQYPNRLELTDTAGNQITIQTEISPAGSDYAYTSGDGNTTIRPLLTILNNLHVGTIDLGVTFGSAFTITKTGKITAAGGDALYVYQPNLGRYTATNYGTISSQSGTGVVLQQGALLTNNGLITVASGAAGIDGSNDYVVNNGIILGGTLAAVNNVAHFTNTGTVTAGVGGAGASVSNLNNYGLIQGGLQLARTDFGDYGVRTSNFFGGTVINSGIIIGGAGAPGVQGFFGALSSENFINSGTILGGPGGVNGYLGNGGNGLLLNDGTFHNTGLIAAGHDGGGTPTADDRGFPPGYGVRISGGAFINSGIVLGDMNGGTGLYSTSGFVLNTGSILSGASTSNILNGSIGAGIEVRTAPNGIASVTNAGLVKSFLGIGAYLGTGAVVTNTGTIIGGTDGVEIVSEGATFINAGFIGGGTRALVFKSNGTIGSGDTVPGVISELVIMPGSTFSGIVDGQSNYPNLLEFGGNTGASLSGIGTEFLNFGNLSFASGDDYTIEGNAAGLANGQTISGFAAGNTIILDNFVVNTLDTTYVTGTGLELTDTLGNHVTLDIIGSFSTSSFIVFDPPGSTTIEVATCYLPGTNILTPAGERAIETLRVGDSVITKFGGYQKIKWIGRQSFARPFIANNREQIPVRFMAGALGRNLPKRDLFVSPGHSMLIGGVLVLAKSLVNGITIRQDTCPEQVDYFQLEFETHDCVLAEGVWSESYADTPDWRDKFHNAAEFYELFPNHVAAVTQRLCAERPLAGAALARALRPVVLLAGLTARPGRLRGCIDQSSAGFVRGWAQDEAYPLLPVQLEIWAAGQMAGHVLACDERADLAAAGIGHGRCAFEFAMPDGCPMADVQVRRASDGATLPAAVKMTEAA